MSWRINNLDERDIDFDKVKTKYITGKWDSFNKGNLREQQRRFYNFCIETYVSVNLPDVYNQNAGMDVTWNWNGKLVTPDFIVRENGIDFPVEFKCSRLRLGDGRRAVLKDDAQFTYGPSVRLIILTIDENFGNNIRNREWREIFFILSRAMESTFMKLDKFERSQFQDEDQYPSKTELIQKSKEFQSVKLPKYDYNTEQGSINLEVLEYYDQMEDWANAQVLPTHDMAKYINPPVNANTWLDHPWDRDGNRQRTSMDRSSDMKWGHKATVMYQLPVNGLANQMTLEEALFAVQTIDSPFSEYLAQLVNCHIRCSDELFALKEVLSLKAKCKTTYNSDQMAELAEERGLEASHVIKDLDDQVKGIKSVIESKMGRSIKLTKHGNISVPSQAFDAYSKKRVKGVKDEVDVMEFGDFFRDKDFSSWFRPRQLKANDFKDAYPTNESLNNISNSLSEKAEMRLNEVLTSSKFSSVYSMIQFYRAIIAAAPRLKTKGYRNNEAILTKHPDGFFIMISPSPNEIVSGVCVIIAKTTSHLPDWCCPGDSIKREDEWFSVSKPFRVNLKIACDADGILGCYLGNAILSSTYGFAGHDWWWTSLFWTFTRQLTALADIVYLFYKNLTNVLNFGITEIVKKANNVQYRDVRVTTAMYRLKAKYHETVTLVHSNLREDVNAFEGVVDPLILAKHAGWQTMMSVTYMKQIFSKHDGYDSGQILGDLFRGEMEHQSWMDSSPFNPTNMDPFESCPLDYFFEELFREAPWSKLSYHPDSCFNYMCSMISRAQSIDPSVNPYRDWSREALFTGKSTKCYITTEQHKMYGVDEKFEKIAKERSKYKGIISSNTTEALALEQKALNEHLKDVTKDPTIESPWAGYTFKETDKLSSMIELIAYEVMVYPDSVVVNMVDKEQAGFAKRAFFVQLIFDRNANKLWDETYRPILKVDPHDMILTPGLEKYINNQSKMAKVGYELGKMGISKDATRFGDTYMIETLRIQLLAMLECQYLSKSETKMLYHFCNRLANRVVLMPHQSAKLMNNRIQVNDHKRKWVLEFESYASYLNNPDRFKGFEKVTVFNEVKDNICMQKSVGFVLGVFNMAGSMYTSAYSQMIYDIEKLLGIENVAESQTHSDDCHEVTNLDLPNAAEFVAASAKQFVRDRLTYGVGELIRIGGNWTYKLDGNIYRVPEIVISKLHVVLGLFTPRFFSQRPSLLKWAIGFSNEVLQVFSFNGQIKVPFIRYASALGKLLPGESPASDTYMMSGRYYDIAVNGGTMDLLSGLIVAGNFLITDSYGLHNSVRSVNEPPEILGLWWCIPSFIYLQGFESNEVRLYSSSNRHTQTLLKLLINTDETWKKRDNIDEVKEDQVKVSDIVLESLGLDDYVNEVGGIEYRKDMRLRYSKHQKTDMGFAKLISCFREEFNGLMITVLSKTIKYGDLKFNDSDMIKVLKDEYFMEIQTGSKSLIKNMVSVVAKYTTPGMMKDYARNSPDLKLIAKLGFADRSIGNPFSDNMRLNLGFVFSKLQDEIMTMTEYYQLVRDISGSAHYTPFEMGEKGYKMAKRLMSAMISDVNNLRIYPVGRSIERHTDDIDLVYTRVKPRTSYSGLGKYVTKSLAVVFEMGTKGVRIDETQTVKNNTFLANNSAFLDQVLVTRQFLAGLGFKMGDLLFHFRLLARLLTPIGFQGVAAIPRDNTSMVGYLGHMWSVKKGKIFQANYNPSNDVEELKPVTVEDIMGIRYERPLAIALWKNYLLDPADSSWVDMPGEIMSGSKSYPIPNIGAVIKVMLDGGFTRIKANQLLSLFLYSRVAGRATLSTHRKISVTQTKTTMSACLSYRGAFTIKVVATKENKTVEHRIEIGDMNLDSTRGQFAWILGQWVTYFYFPKGYRLLSIESLVSDKKTNYVMFRGTGKFGFEIAYEDTPNETWTFLNISNTEPDCNDMVEGDISPVGFRFHDRSAEDPKYQYYFLTMWDIGTDPTNLAYRDVKGRLSLDEFNSSVAAVATEYTYQQGGAWMKMSLTEAWEVFECVNNFCGINHKIIMTSSEQIQQIRLMEIYIGVDIDFVRKTLILNAGPKIKTLKAKLMSGLSNLIGVWCSEMPQDLYLPEMCRIIGWCVLTEMANEDRKQGTEIVDEYFIDEFNLTNGGDYFSKTLVMEQGDKYSFDPYNIRFSNVEITKKMYHQIPINIIKAVFSSDPKFSDITPYFTADPLLINNNNVDIGYIANISEIGGKRYTNMLKQILNL